MNTSIPALRSMLRKYAFAAVAVISILSYAVPVNAEPGKDPNPQNGRKKASVASSGKSGGKSCCSGSGSRAVLIQKTNPAAKKAAVKK